MERVSLEDAFAICLMLRVDQARYERACTRWIERFTGEVDGVTLMDLYQARVSSKDCRLERRSGLAPMVDLLGRYGLARAAERLSALTRW